MAVFDTVLHQSLVGILGQAHVITNADECAYFSQDVFRESDHTSAAVIQPENTQQLAQAVKAATSADYALFPRGGGMSYTSGYLPTETRSISVDTSRMNRVLEVNTTDMYVTVECGCTWADLQGALKGTSLRPPFWGTLSGYVATVGGGISQNSIFFGSGLHGTAANSVIGMEIVCADGSVLSTGSAGTKNGSPHMRHYGPDLTGLFTADAGALGIKATITLQLIIEPAEKGFSSFNFTTHEAMFEAAAEISRRGLASEAFGFDPYLQSLRMKRESLLKDVQILSGVMKSSGSVLSAIKEGGKMALAGRRYMDDARYSYHFITEQNSKAAVKAALKAIEAIAVEYGGEVLENSIPKIISGNPFMPISNMVGPDGERWLPVHGLIPHSKATAMKDAIEAYFEENRAILDRYGIETGYLFATVGASTSMLEPLFYWPDAITEIHKRNLDPAALKRIKGFGEDIDARAAVTKLRKGLAEVFLNEGAVHLQIGKTYLYSEGIGAGNLALVKALKQHLDPNNRINPGALGLANE